MPSPQPPSRNLSRKSPPVRARSQSPAHPVAFPPASDTPQATANLAQRETAAPPPSAARTAAANTPPRSSSHAHSATMHAAQTSESVRFSPQSSDYAFLRENDVSACSSALPVRWNSHEEITRPFQHC